MRDFPDLSTPCPEAMTDTIQAEELGLDALDLAILGLQRLFFRSFSDPQSQAWMQAFASDDDTLARLPQGGAAYLVLTQVQAMQGVRKTGFRFSNPFCPVCSGRLTADETDLVSLFHACRRRSLAQRATLATVLSDGIANPGLELASQRLADALCPAPARLN